MKKILISLMFLFAPVCQLMTFSQGVVPCPNQVSYGNDSIRFKDKLSVSFPQKFHREGKMLIAWLEENTNLKIKHVKKEKGADFILQAESESKSAEGYSLYTDKGKVYVRAYDSAGVFYGIQSLKQLVYISNNTVTFPNVSIEDAPRFAWRGFMLDEARHFKGKEVVKQLLDEMAMLKLNVFHWHLTNDQGWRIEIKKYPKLTSVGAYRDSTEINHFESNLFDGKPHQGFYSQDDLREIVKYAAERHIHVVPEITVPGHITAACAAYPWLGTSGKPVKVSPKFGVHYHAINVAEPRVYQFLSDVFDELIDIFPFPIIHIGGDEVRYNQWNESADIQKFMKQHNIASGADVQIYFTNRLSQMLAKKGRRMIGWNEITGDRLHHYQANDESKGLKNELAKGTIVQFWQGNPSLIKKTIEKGYDVVNSTNVFTYLDYNYNAISLEKAYSFNPVPEGLSPEQEKRLKGISCQMWGEFIPTVEKMNWLVYPRIAAYAEVGWTEKDKLNYERFLKSLQPVLKRWSDKGIKYGPIK